MLRVANPTVPVAVLNETERCAECHADIVAQWNGSAHRFASFANPFYLHALQTLEQARGREVTRFCAGCHDPLPLLAGVFESGAPLSETLPFADRGVTCLICHTTFHAGDPRGNGAIATAVRPRSGRQRIARRRAIPCRRGSPASRRALTSRGSRRRC